ncbi:retron Eco8 family effector endonuclease, partial [Klebsiella pneumoniae]
IIRLFKGEGEHYIFHFSLGAHRITKICLLNSRFKDKRFLNIFSDNEARLFFSEFILFVEGETELELFGNLELINKFSFLNRVDVYKTNEVLLRAMNPRNSNAPIPYLTVYDADKLVTYDFQDRRFKFRSKEINLLDIYKRYSCTPFFSPNYQNKRILSNIIKIDGVELELDENGISYKKLDLPAFIARCNRVLYKTDRIHMAPSTIEEVLICNASRKILIRWLAHEAASLSKGKLCIGGKGDINRKLDGLRSKFKLSNLKWFFTNVFTKHEYTGELSPENEDFIAMLYVLNAKEMLRLFYKKGSSLSQADQTTILRLALNGKSHTLYSYKESEEPYDENNPISFEVINAVQVIKNQFLKKLSIDLGKTGGWVTSFLDFAIADIEKRTTNDKSFEEIFASTFPHLHDILKKISTSIA